MIILDDDDHTRLTIWHLNQFIGARTQRQRYVCVYLYVQRYLSKIPFLVKYLKCLCISQQARVELWGLERCQTRPHHQLLATVLWVSQHWELKALRGIPERQDCWSQFSVAQESLKCLSQDHCLQSFEIFGFSHQSICTLTVIQDKNFTQKSNNGNIVPRRLSFRQK